MSLKVDPEALRKFAGALTAFAGDVKGIDTGTAFAGAGTALPGTDFDAICQRCTDVTAAAMSHVSGQMDNTAHAAAGSAGNYDVTEAAFVSELAGQGRQL